jgi:glycosyltransferase involved in cell wall biosynthesis
VNILLIADPHLPVPPLRYGGAERVAALYAAELSRLGHRVDLLAAAGSQPFGGCLYHHRAPSGHWPSRAQRKLRFQLQSLRAARQCDVVYNLGRFDYMEALLAIRKPLLHCFSHPLDQALIDAAEARIRAHAGFHFVSEHQRAAAAVSAPAVTIPNPVDSRYYQPGPGDGGYLLFLGRLSPHKGVDLAIAAAQRAGVPLVIAGNRPEEPGAAAFFKEQIEPHLDGQRVRWIGAVTDQQKQELLGRAAALLFPIRWDEPFGIVMVEALACGTPVIATRRASTPEVIEHGRTGWLCEPSGPRGEPKVEELAEAVARLPRLERRHCRQAAEQRFDVRVLTPLLLSSLAALR